MTKKGVILSIRRNCPFGAIGVQSGQSPKNNEKGGQPESGPGNRVPIVPAFVCL